MSHSRSRRLSFVGLLVGMLMSWNSATSKEQGCISHGEIPGPEDFVLDNVTAKGPRLIVSSQDRRAKHSGGLFSVPIQGGKVGPACPIDTGIPDFRPHGLELQGLGGGSLRLFVVNHGSEEAIISFDIGADGGFKPDSSSRYTHAELLTHGNDLATWRDRVFVSNNRSVMGFVLPWSNPGRVVTFEIGDDPGGRTWSELKAGFRFANGVAVANAEDERTNLYIADSGRRQIRVIRLGEQPQEDAVIPVSGMVDNFTWNPEKTELLVAAHSSLLRFSLHGKWRDFNSPSEIYRIDAQTHRVQRIAPQKLTGVNAASTALLYEGTLYLGKVFDPGITVIPNAEELFEDYRD